MKYTLTLPDGATATPAEASAKKGPGDNDTQPRQFWVDIKSGGPLVEAGLKLEYVGCTTDLCLALTHEYTIRFESEDRGARTYGLNRGQSSRNRKSGNRDPRGREGRDRPSNDKSRMQRMDADRDGSISLEEMCASDRKRRGAEFSAERARKKFDKIDSDKDGVLSAEELNKAPRGRIPQQQ